MLSWGRVLIHCLHVPSIIKGRERAASRSVWPAIPIAIRYVSSHTEGSYEGSYFSISFGALKFAGYFSPRIIGPKHLGPRRLATPLARRRSDWLGRVAGHRAGVRASFGC